MKSKIVLLGACMCLLLVSCGKEDTQMGNLDKVAENSNVSEVGQGDSTTEYDSPYEYSDGLGTTDYGEWWNFVKKDGERVLVFDGEENKLTLLTVIPDKLPPNTKIQILNMKYIQLRSDIVEGRTLAELESTDDSPTIIYLDVTDSPELIFEGSSYVNIQTDRSRIGVVKYKEPDSEEEHDVTILTGTVVIEH